MLYNSELDLILCDQTDSNDSILDDYQCECLLGRGSYSRVMKCKNLKSGEYVAVKVLIVVYL